MKGIAFIGGKAPKAENYLSLVKDAALIVAADSGIHTAEAWGLHADWVVGDMDSIVCGKVLEKYDAERVLRYPADKDFTDTELAIELLFEKGCDTVTLIGGGGGRLAHILALAALFEREQRPSHWITDREEIFPVSNTLDIETKTGTLISVFPLGDGPWSAESMHLKWELDGLNWRRGFFGISNRAEENTVKIKVNHGLFLVIVEQKSTR